MPDDTNFTLAQQLKQHLAALKTAGIEYLPRSHGVLPVVMPAPAIAPLEPRPQAVPPEVPQTLPNTPREPVAVAPPPTPLPSEPPAVVASATSLFGAPPGDIPTTVDGRRHELKLLAGRVAECSRCPALFATRTQTVFGVGPTEPEVCFVGEAPGADEDAQGEPFVGAAGQLLNKIIAASGFERQNVYICNILKCRPPRNRTPAPDECVNCREYLDRQIELVKPKYLVALGAVAAQNLLRTTTGIMKLRGKFYRYQGIPLMCTFHPAALLRNEAWKKDCWNDMKMLLKEMGRPVPNNRS